MNYIVLSKRGLYCFYGKHGGLFWKQYTDNKWSKSSCIKKDGVINFSVSLFEGNILILCQRASQVEKIIFEQGVLTTSTLVSGGLAGQYYGIGLQDDIYVIHSIPVQAEPSHILMSHNVSSQGMWSNSKHLGRVVPYDGGNSFRVVPICGQHYLVFYQAAASGSGADFGYREVYGADTMSDFKIIQPSANINTQNSSFLASTEAIHMVYVTKNILNTSLVYRRLDANGLSPKVAISSGHQVYNTLIYIEDNVVHVVFARGDEVFECTILEDEQLYASTPKRHVDKYPQQTSVSVFLQDKEYKNDFLTNSIYVSAEKPWDVQLFSQIYHIIDNQQKTSHQYIYEHQNHQIGSQNEYDSFFESFDDVDEIKKIIRTSQ